MWIDPLLVVVLWGADLPGPDSLAMGAVLAEPQLPPEGVWQPIPVQVWRENGDKTFRDPFDRIPQPLPIGSGNESTENPLQQKTGEDIYVVFSHPATFELSAFQPTETRWATDTAVIYEGMALRFDKSTGNYTLRMVIETPPTNVTMRLQLGVIRQCTVRHFSEAGKAPVRIGTITLPPIRFEGATQFSRDSQPRLWKIQHEGNSALLLTPPAGAECGHDLSFTRSGTAEFGLAPQR